MCLGVPRREAECGEQGRLGPEHQGPLGPSMPGREGPGVLRALAPVPSLFLPPLSQVSLQEAQGQRPEGGGRGNGDLGQPGPIPSTPFWGSARPRCVLLHVGWVCCFPCRRTDCSVICVLEKPGGARQERPWDLVIEVPCHSEEDLIFQGAIIWSKTDGS